MSHLLSNLFTGSKSTNALNTSYFPLLYKMLTTAQPLAYKTLSLFNSSQYLLFLCQCHHPYSNHQPAPLWKSQITHSNMHHLSSISGINFLLHFASLVQISLLHFHFISLMLVHHLHHHQFHHPTHLHASVSLQIINLSAPETFHITVRT